MLQITVRGFSKLERIVYLLNDLVEEERHRSQDEGMKLIYCLEDAVLRGYDLIGKIQLRRSTGLE